MASPAPLLREAQLAINAGNHARAVEIFTQIHAQFPSIHPSLPLLSRAIAYLELKEFEKGIQDCNDVLAIPDVPIPDGIVMGCNTSHAAAAGLLAKLHKANGQEGMSEMHMRMMNEKRQEAANQIQEALSLKEKGNELWRKGQISEAVSVYEQSVSKDATNEATWSNLSQGYLKLGKFDRAEAAARQCTLVKPSFAKGWFRLGMALSAQEKFPEAMAAFHSGLKYAPEDPELKAKYQEAATQAEKNGYEKVLMGLMVDLARESFDIRSWWRSYSTVIDFLDPKATWEEEFVPVLSSAEFKNAVQVALQAAVPDADASKGPASAFSAGDFSFGPDAMESYVHHAMLGHPVATAAYLLPLIRETDAKGDWHAVISFNFKTPKGAEEVPQIYTALVDKKRMKVVDWEGLALDYRNAMGRGPMEKDKKWNGQLFRALVDDIADDKIIYTTADSKMLSDFVTEFYAAERRSPTPANAKTQGKEISAAAPQPTAAKNSAAAPGLFERLDQLLNPDSLLKIFGAAAVLLAIYIALTATSAGPVSEPEEK